MRLECGAELGPDREDEVKTDSELRWSPIVRLCWGTLVSLN